MFGKDSTTKMPIEFRRISTEIFADSTEKSSVFADKTSCLRIGE